MVSSLGNKVNNTLFFCMIWFPTAIMKPQKHKNHMFIDFFNNLISAHFFLDSNDILSYLISIHFQKKPTFDNI